jgi:hypothetical protein
MSEIFREIDEELRRDNILKLWARYGRYIIGVGVVAVVIAALAVGWRQHQAGLRQAEGLQYAAAAAEARKGELIKAADAFSALAGEAGAGQAVLARLQEASLRARAGDDKAALSLYQALAHDGSADAPYRDLATLLSALLELKTADPKTVIADAAPLLAADNPWRFSALEITALAQLRAGDRAAAREAYKKLADDLAAPSRLRARAAEMSAALAD